MSDAPETRTLLARWHAGDDQALDELLRRDLPWLRRVVRTRLGAALGARADADDIVQQAMIDVLRHGPRFLVGDVEHYRALLARIVENAVRKALRDARRQKRDVAREQPLPSRSVLQLGSPRTGPATSADRNERRAWVQLGLELLDPDDREIVLRRQWDGLEFEQLAAELGTSPDAARMRFQRAVGRLARIVKRLRQGDLRSALSSD